MSTEMVFHFDHPHTGTFDDITKVVGGKGASLWAMHSKLSLPTPPGFTIGVDICDLLDSSGMTEGFSADLDAAIASLEEVTNRRFGGQTKPLLLSVRSGASASMPGMMETILNLGVTPLTMPAIKEMTGDHSFAWDSYWRFLSGYCKSVLQISEARIMTLTNKIDSLEDRTRRIEDLVNEEIGFDQLCDPRYLLRECIKAVVHSRHSAPAKSYRNKVGLPDSLGTAVTIQAMVFGNIGSDSGTGVAFSRDPNTGEARICGDWMADAQGDDVVAGNSVTADISEFADRLPHAYAELEDHLHRLEVFYQDMVDVEFTVEQGKLWVLQARIGKRTSAAASRIAVEMATSDRFDLKKKEALNRVCTGLSKNGRETRQVTEQKKPIAIGIAASSGVGSGIVALSAEAAIEASEGGQEVVLIRRETSPADVHGMAVASGILTSLGGLMSHAAVVARDWNLPAIVGVESIQFIENGLMIGGVHVKSGDTITINGSTGEVHLGELSSSIVKDPYREQLEAWAETED